MMVKCNQCKKSIMPHTSWSKEWVKENLDNIYCNAICIKLYYASLKPKKE